MAIAETTEATRQAPLFEFLAEDLVALGVEAVFGLFGEETMGIAVSLSGAGIPYYAGRHENECVMMANGYSHATGKLGVALTSRGPGLTNGLTAAVTSARSGARALIIMGANAVGGHGANANYKHLDGQAVFTSCGVASYLPRTAAQAREALHEAAAVAMTGRTVGLHLPLDILNAQTSQTDAARPAAAVGAVPSEPPAESVDLAASVVDRSRRILLVAGVGAHRSGAREALIELADRTGALLGTSLYAKGLFEGHPFNIGLVGGFGSSAAREVTQDLGCVVAFGASLNQFTTEFGSWFRGATLIHVDDRRENIGRYFRADIAVAGDARIVAERLLRAVEAKDDKPLRSDDVASRLAGYDATADFVPVQEEGLLDPQALIYELDRILPADRMVVPDGGAHFCFVSPYMSVQSPDCYHAPIDFHSIGLGVGTAVGAAIGRPEKPTVLFVGDGALLMSIGDLETVGRTGMPILVVVVNDRSYGSELHHADAAGLAPEVTLIPDIDFATAARGLGLEALTIRSLDDLEPIREQISQLQKPLLLDCKVAQARPQLYEMLMHSEDE
jgi:thiamine pyrophosphate-dependent acetolactate synthase large subunit-like protein